MFRRGGWSPFRVWGDKGGIRFWDVRKGKGKVALPASWWAKREVYIAFSDAQK